MLDERYLQELSSLLDGECTQSEMVIDRAAADDNCRSKWQSYHLIRDVMQKECHSALSSDFCSRVSAEIAREDNIDSTSDVISFASAGASVRASRSRAVRRPAAAPAAPRWLPFAGLGLAASVAAAGFIGWQVLQNFDATTNGQQGITVAQVDAPSPENPIADAVAESGVESGLIRAVYRGETGTRWVAVSGQHNEKVEQRLNSLLLNHLEDSSMTRVQGMAVHSRLVGYDRAQVNESF